MDKLDGVVSQRVGYTGGDSDNPTYGTVCGGDGHTEAVKIEFDPNVISYEQLLDTFWAEHNPSGYKPKVQYKSAIWPQNEAQEAAARASKKAIEDKYNKTLHTDIEPPKTWCVPKVSRFFFFAPTAPRARALASARG